MTNSSIGDPEAVSSFRDLAAYVGHLLRQVMQRPEDFENMTLDGYLEALGAFVGDLDAYFLNQGTVSPEQPSWALMAEILTAATIYE